MEEIWNKSTYDGYQASNLGNIKSVDRLVYNKGTKKYMLIKGKIIKQTTNNSGYKLVTISINGKVYTKSVHRMVWEAFNGKIPEGMEVNHIDSNTTNNSLSNLNLMSHSDNILFGSWKNRQRDSHLNRKDKSKTVLQFDLNGNFIKEWPSTKEIEREYGFLSQSISACCKNYKYRKTAYGYIWKYSN